jgi:hypothetical protein
MAMHERRQLPLMVRLTSVQRARRAAAESALAAASSAEKRAQRAEEAAREQSRVAELQWLDYVAEPGFSPEYSRSLSARLIDRDTAAAGAALRTRQQSVLRAARQQDWQLSEARVRLSEASVRRLRRKIERRAEEDRLAELADRVTYSWSRS